MFAKTAVSAVSRVGSRRAMSDAPKLHTAKNSWKTINSTRPVDPHPHVSLSVCRICVLYYVFVGIQCQEAVCFYFILNLLFGVNAIIEKSWSDFRKGSKYYLIWLFWRCCTFFHLFSPISHSFCQLIECI